MKFFKRSKKKTNWKYILIVVIVAVLVGGVLCWQFCLKDKAVSLEEEGEEPTSWETYRNEEFGFEFQYPSNWKIIENPYGSPFSKFNLIVVPAEGKYLPDPILVNIVVSDFADNAFSDLLWIDVVVANVVGKKYEYEEESLSEISIVLPFGKDKIILGANKTYEDVFNQVVSSFRFIEE